MIDKDIKDLNTKGNIFRSKSDTLNNLFQEGKEISRKLEIRKGNAKLILEIQGNDTIHTEKEEILTHIHTFYQKRASFSAIVYM